MNIKRNARVAVALASCALITAPAAQAVLQNAGRTYTSTYTQPQGDDHARTDPAVAVAVPLIAIGDDHARTDSATAAISVPLTPPQAVATRSSGFDWEDAGIGFGTAVGLALLTAGAVVSTRKPRQPHTSFV
jgi:hypothetical protein